MDIADRKLLSGDEAVALAAIDCGISLGIGYPGTPSTEILEAFSALGGKAQWSPNEKVALEVALGAAFAGARAIVTMKHVGLNVAADPLFTAAYTGVEGALVIVSADDPGMASSQNEQDNRHYAQAAGLPMLEPADSQEAYDLFAQAVGISERWRLPVLLRMTTRVCHSKTIVQRSKFPAAQITPRFTRSVTDRVMIPAYARPAHRRLRQKLAEITAWGETADINVELPADSGDGTWGIITSGIAAMHAREAAPQARMLKLAMTYPLPIKRIRKFAESLDRCVIVEEGDPYLLDAIRAAGVDVEGKDEMYRFGELDVSRVRRLLAGQTADEPAPPRGKPPQLCPGCPHRKVFELLRDEACIVAGDIGCYTLGVLPPFEAMDTCVCMGASIGVGLGLRHALGAKGGRKVVSVIGDSTFIHSGITGLVEMVYNPPPGGHLVLVLDNGTTAMTGLQEHPGTGRTLDHKPTHQIMIEDLARAIGIENVQVIDPFTEGQRLADEVRAALASNKLSVIVVRRPCLLAAAKIRQYAPAGEGE